MLDRGLSDRTADCYAAVLRRLSAWCEGEGVDLASASARQLRPYVEQQVPLTRSSRVQFRTTLRWLWRLTGRDAGPSDFVRVPPKRRMRCKALDADDARRLEKAACGRHPEGVAVLLGLYLGLRRQEIASLRWSQFDADRAWLHVQGKGDVAADLPVHPVMADELDVYEATSRPAHAGSCGCGCRLVFPSRRPPGSTVCPATVWNWTLKVAEQAGVGRVTPHQLRHTCLATANDATGDLRATQEFARHARPETTAGYTRAGRERLWKVARALDYRADGQQSGR